MKAIFDLIRFGDDVPRYRSQGWHHSTSDFPFLGFTIAFMTFMFLFEILLDYRQLTKFQETKKVPKQLEGIVEKEVFEKANACKLKTLLISLPFSFLPHFL